MNNVKELAAQIARDLIEHPETWGIGTRGTLSLSKRIDNSYVWSTDWLQARDHFLAVACAIEGCRYASLVTWERKPWRTVADVIALCERVAAGVADKN